MTRFRLLLFLVPILAGLTVAAFFVARAPGPEKTQATPSAVAVRVVEARMEEVRPVARGWGNARASETWTAVAEVAGRIVFRHPELESGRLILAGTKVLEIDPADYRLAIAQAEADLAGLEAEKAQLAAEEENTRRILALEEERLALTEEELARTRALVERGTVPQTRADEQERATLQIRRTVAELRNTLTLLPSRRDRLAAQVARVEAALARARRDLEHTAITAPIDIRVDTVEIERFEYVNIGQRLLVGHGVDRAEVVAHVPLDSFVRLLGSAHDDDVDPLAALREGPAERIEAVLRLVSHPEQVWRGRVRRVEGELDPQARSVRVVVSVDDPYAGAAPPARLPLVPNMYVEATLTGPPLPPSVVVPEEAVHGGDTVYVRDEEGRLDARRVRVAFRQHGEAVIAGGLAAGESVVLDDLSPALPGTPLSVVEETP
ncbi:efflux RND transporter periplasmic adaptor subunit [Salinarimonas ramus]|uniref:Acriflavin resistance protein n=1 Tax=Salinarimonas ramus TaxID=690164 RepID=A0A917V8T2_9HYPH|nr:efflux transporter periplasmic adaptor subunit [Salinarimonas ramus]GGK51095.1 acriflavin resistance protein [Salinarimonas ramus]